MKASTGATLVRMRAALDVMSMELEQAKVDARANKAMAVRDGRKLMELRRIFDTGVSADIIEAVERATTGFWTGSYDEGAEYVFAKSQYEAIAAVIKTSRKNINDRIDAGEMTESQARLAHEALSDVTAGFIKTFERDNKKFKSLLFIEACGVVHDNDTSEG